MRSASGSRRTVNSYAASLQLSFTSHQPRDTYYLHATNPSFSFHYKTV